MCGVRNAVQGDYSLMARFEMQLPEAIIKDFQKIYDNADQIFGEMTKAGAEVTMHNIQANVPASF